MITKRQIKDIQVHSRYITKTIPENEVVVLELIKLDNPVFYHGTIIKFTDAYVNDYEAKEKYTTEEQFKETYLQKTGNTDWLMQGLRNLRSKYGKYNVQASITNDGLCLSVDIGSDQGVDNSIDEHMIRSMSEVGFTYSPDARSFYIDLNN